MIVSFSDIPFLSFSLAISFRVFQLPLTFCALKNVLHKTSRKLNIIKKHVNDRCCLILNPSIFWAELSFARLFPTFLADCKDRFSSALACVVASQCISKSTHNIRSKKWRGITLGAADRNN